MPEKLKEFLWAEFSISKNHWEALILIYKYMNKYCNSIIRVDGIEVPGFFYDFLEACYETDVDITKDELLDCLIA